MITQPILISPIAFPDYIARGLVESMHLYLDTAVKLNRSMDLAETNEEVAAFMDTLLSYTRDVVKTAQHSLLASILEEEDFKHLTNEIVDLVEISRQAE